VLRYPTTTTRPTLATALSPHNIDQSNYTTNIQLINMKLAIFASLLAGAAAFAPVQQSARTSVATNMAFENELGAQAPLGFFDPLGLVADGDQAKFDRLRYVEIKHGRICMLAVAGYLTQEAGVRLPGDIDYSGLAFADVPNGFKALSTIQGAGIAQIIAFIGFLELFVMKDITGGEFVGDFRNGALDFGWDSFDAETKMSKRAIELNQGRAAQMGILALMVHEQLGVSLIPGQ
jgi:Chlorophyll A-B binding protein